MPLTDSLILIIFFCLGVVFYVHPYAFFAWAAGLVMGIIIAPLAVELLETGRVCPQVSYGEFLSCSKFSKFARINSRRADFVVITKAHRVALVVELQGSGHFGSTSKSACKAQKADQTKRSALQEASIPLLEVASAASEDALTAQIQGLITPQQGEHTT